MASGNIRYGATLRKRYNSVRKMKISLYKCNSCGKVSVEHISTGIWRCRHCGRVIAGGAYTPYTPAGDAAKHSIESLNKALSQKAIEAKEKA